MRQIIINTPTKQYPVHIDSTQNFEPLVHNGKVLVVSNPKVAGLHLSKILPKIMAKEVYVCIIPDGEAYKDFKSVEYILECAFTHKLDRNSLFVAFGGGVVGDIVGFVSGIYQRGVEFVQIPTTLLAQVDSSVGGKTGINNAFGKNLIGLFHQPKAVYANTYLLATLDSREFSAGVAEIIKMAVCFDKQFFAYLQSASLQDSQSLEYVIAKSIEIKADVVSKDEKEKGLRAALNYGHTFGHVIENLTHYKGYLHGECVAIGMCMANDLAFKLSLMTQEEVDCVKNLLAHYNLPTSYKIADVKEFWEKFFLDKKSKDSKITFVLPVHIGDVCMRDDVPKELVIEVLEQYSK